MAKKTLNNILILFLFLSAITLFIKFSHSTKKSNNSQTINLPDNQKLITASLTGENLWIFTRTATPNDTSETYEVKDKNSFNILSGKVNIKESIKTQPNLNLHK